MKMLIVTIVIFALTLGGCKDDKNNQQAKKETSVKQAEHQFRYDDELTTKSKVEIDTLELRKTLNALLPPEKIFELFGDGYQMFYLGVQINPNAPKFIVISTDATYWQGFSNEAKKYLYKDEVDISSEDYAILPSKEGDAKAINVKSIFFKPFFDSKNIFKIEPEVYNNKIVNSIKLFEIDTQIDRNKNIIRPWSIHETDISKFKTALFSKYTKYDFAGYFPAQLSNSFYNIGRQIIFPQKAINHGVKGRMLFKLYFEEKGSFAGYQLIKGLGYGCDEAVIEELKRSRPSALATGQRSTVIITFNFGTSIDAKVDLAVKALDFNPKLSYNQLTLEYENKLNENTSPKRKFIVALYVDGKLNAFDKVAQVPNGGVAALHCGGYPFAKGKHEYMISLDPENVLNDINRENNIVKGTFEVK